MTLTLRLLWRNSACVGKVKTDSAEGNATDFIGSASMTLVKMTEKMKISYLTAFLFACILSGSCSKVDLAGFTDAVSVNVPAAYSAIEVASAIEVQYLEDCLEPQLETDVNILPYVKIHEKRGILRIELDDDVRLANSVWNSLKIILYLPAKQELESVSLSGASSFISDVTLTGDKFTLDVSGASRFTGSVSAESLSVDISGGGTVESGQLTCGHLELSASGGSSLRASGKIILCNMDLSGASSIKDISGSRTYSLEMESCLGELSGASSACFKSDGRIECTLSGASRIYYTGSADCSDSDVHGDGSEIIHEN